MSWTVEHRVCPQTGHTRYEIAENGVAVASVRHSGLAERARELAATYAPRLTGSLAARLALWTLGEGGEP